MAEYIVKENGTIFNKHTNKKMKNSKDRYGYLYVSLFQNGLSKKEKVHRMVAKAFIPNPLNKPQVNHIDGDKTNNNVSNLEWCTHEENMAHAYKLGIQKRRGVMVYDLNGKFLEKYKSIRDCAKKTDIDRRSLQRCLCGEYKQFKGKIYK